MGRKILAVVIGLIAGGFVIMAIESINMLLYPYPEDLSSTEKPEAFMEYLNSLPISALITVLFAHIAGAFAAGALSTKIGQAENLYLAMICGAILLVGAVVNLYLIPHPVWFMIVNVLTIVPAAIFGGKVLAGKPE